MANLFQSLAQQAEHVARRVRSGQQIRLADEAGKHWLLDETAKRLGSDTVVVQVPRDLDKVAYVMLSAAAQCGADALAQTANKLAASQADPTPALETLGQILDGRSLLVDNFDALQGSALDAELREVFAPSLEQTHGWFLRRASVIVTRGERRDDLEHLQLPAEPPASPWLDTAAVWERTRRDVELYTLSLARARLLGADDSRQWDRESIISDLWSALDQDVRDLVSLLVIHGRPVSRSLFERLDLVPPTTLDASLDSLVVEQSPKGMLRLVAPNGWGNILTPASYRERQRSLADAFARSARSGTNDVAPLAVLEAHRHYAAVPDVERARQFARFGVQMLLSTAKRLSIEGRDVPGSYERSAQTYDVVMKLDEQVRSAGDLAGIGRRPRAYSVHYRAYNRYKAGRDDPAKTLLAYREALTLWPQNALFWSRTIGCCFVADRFEEGLRARQDAFESVPSHPLRSAFLIARTVDHLLRRDLPLAALLVWHDHRAETETERRIEKNLLQRLARGWLEARLWTRPWGTIPLRRPAMAQISAMVEEPEPAQRGFLCSLLGATGMGTSPDSAFETAAETLVAELARLVEAPTPDTNAQTRRRDLANSLDLSALHTAEEGLRWTAYLASFDEQVALGKLTERQRQALLSLWQRARQLWPKLRRPSLGFTEEGLLHISWSYSDKLGQTFTVDIDRGGHFDWFYRNASESRFCGTEDEPEVELSEETLRLLVAFSS